MKVPLPGLDAIDLRILRCLQDNARITSPELAQHVGLSPSPCWRRVKSLEKAKVIQRYVTLLDAEALGLSINVFVFVTFEKQIASSLETFRRAVRKRPEVMECYLMTGDFDFLLRVAVSTLNSYEHFLVDYLHRIPGIAAIRSSFALKQLKHTTALPIEEI